MPSKIRVAVLGPINSGKTSLCAALSKNEVPNYYSPTVGVDFMVRIDIPRDIKLQLWDLSGQRRFQNVTNIYLKNVETILLVCDPNDVKSTSELRETYDKLTYYSLITNRHRKIVVCNKSDLSTETSMGKDEMISWAEEIGADYVKTSAKTGDGVDYLYEKILGSMIVKRRPMHRAEENCCCIS